MVERLQRFLPFALLSCFVLALAGLLWNHDPLFSRASFNPYSLVVVGVAVRFGWLEGLLTAAALGALMVLASMSPHQAASLAPGPLFGLGALALIAGSAAESGLRRQRALRDTVARQGGELAVLREKTEVLEAANGELKRTLGEREAGLADLQEVTVRLQSAAGEEFFWTLTDLMAQYLEADQCSVYLLDGQHLVLAAQRGWPSVPAEARRFRLGQDLLSRAVLDKELRTVRDYPEPVELGGELLRLMAVPVLNPVNGAVLAVLSLESMPFARFTRLSANLLQRLAGEAATRIATAEESAALPGDSEVLLNPGFFLRRLRLEVMGRRQGTRPAFLLVLVSCPGFEQLPDAVRTLVERAWQVVCGVALRPDDPRGRVNSETLGFLLRDSRPDGASWMEWELAAPVRCLSHWVPQAGSPRWLISVTSSDRALEPEELLEAGQASLRAGELVERPERAEALPLPDLERETAAVRAILAEVDGLTDQPRVGLAQLQGALARYPESVALYHRAIAFCLLEGEPATLRQASEYFALLRLLARPA